MTKRRKIVGAVAIIIVALLIFALFFTWESDRLSRSVLAALSGPDLKIDAAAVKMNALRGVELRQVQVRGKLEGGVYDLAAEEVRLSHRFWRLLAGELTIDEIVAKKPVAAIVWDAPAPPQKKGSGKNPASPPVAAEPPPPAEEGGLILAMKIRRLALEDATFSMKEAGAQDDMVRFEGLDFELGDLAVDPARGSLLAGLSAKGAMEADTFYGSGVSANEVDGKLALGDSKLTITELSLPIDFGTIEIPKIELDLGRDPYFFSLAGGGDPLLTAKLLGAASGFGNGKLEFQIDGDGSPKGGPRGTGSLAVEAGQLGDMPLLAGLEMLLAGTQLVGRPYSPFAIPFKLDDGDNLTLSPFAIEAGNLRLAAYGRVDLEGPLDLHVEISLPREDVAVKEIPREVLEALTDVDGRVKLPILIAGTIEKPAIRFDSRAWAGLAGRRLVAEGLKRLFGS
jgi:hypothetical protein